MRILISGISLFVYVSLYADKKVPLQSGGEKMLESKEANMDTPSFSDKAEAKKTFDNKPNLKRRLPFFTKNW